MPLKVLSIRVPVEAQGRVAGPMVRNGSAKSRSDLVPLAFRLGGVDLALIATVPFCLKSTTECLRQNNFVRARTPACAVKDKASAADHRLTPPACLA